MKPDICARMKPVGFAGVVAMSLMSTSCFYVWQEPIRYGPGGPGAQQQAPAPGTLDELKAQRERGELEEPKLPQAETRPADKPTTQPTPAPAAPRQEATSVPVARKVPGREGFVFSPYNNKMIDVKGFPKGTKVRDPHYDPSDNKFFRVP